MKANFERKLLNYLYYDLNRLQYFVRDEIFEYDIQSSIHQFLMLSFNNKNALVQRERNGKVDHVIHENDENGKPKHCTLIELKSFIKKHEKLNIKKIEDDIEKLNRLITGSNENTEGYLIIAIKENHFNKTNNSTLSDFIDALSKMNTCNFNIDGKKIKTRIIRSLKTSYVKNDKPVVHKEQIRLFMFQIKKK